MATDFGSAAVLDVALRPGLDPYSFVRVDDFAVTKAVACRVDDPRIAELRPKLVPYAADWKARRLLFTVHGSPAFAQNHAFLYQAQREHAAQAVVLPFKALAGLFGGPGAQPTFLFSVGRCGSTLAADLLKAVGISIASEPGVYEQLVDGRHWAWFNRGARASATVGTTRALSAFFGEPMVVKLRSQCTFVAPEIARATGARCVVILRALEPWAKSTYRAFRNRPDELAWMYAKAIKIFAALERRGHRPQLVWYEDMARDPSSLLRAVGAPDAPSEAQERALAAVYGRDSQEGLSIGRAGSASAMPSATMAEFLRKWQELAPARLLEQYGIAERL
jgi:hypothetical protein